ncbi:YgaB family protein [Gottfriedia luciferensis]|uniref:YgaB family protein n=1 Tax=Gottfriedia luciferensis TaxID=178774 RepID=UPI000B43C664|nr:YgaB family protein [Gottfriedia luciferensis]
MQVFDELVSRQLETMDQLIKIQEEIERCQEIENQLFELEDLSKLSSIQDEIHIMRTELKAIQNTFLLQTQQIIKSFSDERKIALK